MEFTGEFETHITVQPAGPGRIEQLKRWGIDHDLKCLLIVFDRGATPSQPMLTRQGRGNLTDELATAAQLSQSLHGAGFKVTRIKIEAAPWTEGVPQTDAEAADQPPDRYFEHHVKLLLQPAADCAALAQIAEKHSAHLSRNSLRQRIDGHQERFVTQRCAAVGRVQAQLRLYGLLDALAPLGHPVLEVEEEFVVYDSNLDLDAGWIQS